MNNIIPYNTTVTVKKGFFSGYMGKVIDYNKTKDTYTIVFFDDNIKQKELHRDYIRPSKLLEKFSGRFS